MLDICTIAHITRDKITTPEETRLMPGGTAFYFGMAMQNLPSAHKLITKLAPSDHHLLESMDGLDVVTIPCHASHNYENIYRNESDIREQKVHSLAAPFEIADIPNVESKYFHLGPLSRNDIPIELIAYLKDFGKISIDAQGLLRDIMNKKVVPCKWEKKEDGLRLIDVIKVNEYEAATLTGHNEIEAAARELASYGIGEVVITLGSKGSIIYQNEQFTRIPAYKPANIKDATGCGDTYMAGYLFRRSRGDSVDNAGKFGAAMATLKIEDFGPLRKSIPEIEKVIEISAS